MKISNLFGASLVAAILSTTCAISAFAADKAPAKAKSGLKETLTAQTTQMWQNFKDKKVEEFTGMLADDFVNIDWSGVAKKSDLAGAIPDYAGVHFKPDKFQLVKPDSKTAVLVYHVAFKGTYKGKQAGPTSINATDLWANRDGKWLAVLHTETAAPEATP